MFNVDKIPTFCIHVKDRDDRLHIMNRQLKLYSIKAQYHTVNRSANPARGCMKAHLDIINRANNKGYSHILILEDDAKFIKSFNRLPMPPDDWDMLYLGGTVHENMSGDNKGQWIRVSTWTTHAYIINLSNKALVNDILQAMEKIDKYQIDEYYIKHIHYKYKAYMINPMRVIQYDGYSDVEGRNVEYSFMAGSINGFKQPLHELTETGEYMLKTEPISPAHLPNVSIITPTCNRRKLFPMALRNWMSFNYPREKMEWIIIDDSNEPMTDIIPRSDTRIKYHHFKSITGGRTSIPCKRNMGCELATSDYIIHMDDDDYYPEESIMIRVKLLIQYMNKGVECVGCSKIGVYNLITGESTISTDGITSLAEASMAYTKNFWRSQKFDETEETGEYRGFIRGRFNKILDVPYSFIIYAMNHKDNKTNRSANNAAQLINKSTGKPDTFYNYWPEEVQCFVDDLRKVI